jgi:hypothetical protein
VTDWSCAIRRSPPSSKGRAPARVVVS